MAEDQMQLQRHELKYLISEAVAVEIRQFIGSFLEIDEFGASRPDLSYPVHSLYLDSPLLVTYWHTINGNKNRYKLRIRFYDDRPDSPVFLEIKRRMNDAILKQRGALKREFIGSFMNGQLPEASMIASKDPKQMGAVMRFHELMQKHQARPTAHVFYMREAWISPYDNSVRVTMDRNVLCVPESTTDFKAEVDDPVCVFGRKVVLELKFTGRFPNWFRDLVQSFGLMQCSAAKYADGIALKGERFFSDSIHVGSPASDSLILRDKRIAELGVNQSESRTSPHKE